MLFTSAFPFCCDMDSTIYPSDVYLLFLTILSHGILYLEVYLKFCQYQALGDLGLVAKASRSSQSLMRKPEALTVTKVFDTFRLIAQVLFPHIIYA